MEGEDILRILAHLKCSLLRLCLAAGEGSSRISRIESSMPVVLVEDVKPCHMKDMKRHWLWLSWVGP